MLSLTQVTMHPPPLMLLPHTPHPHPHMELPLPHIVLPHMTLLKRKWNTLITIITTMPLPLNQVINPLIILLLPIMPQPTRPLLLPTTPLLQPIMPLPMIAMLHHIMVTKLFEILEMSSLIKNE